MYPSFQIGRLQAVDLRSQPFDLPKPTSALSHCFDQLNRAAFEGGIDLPEMGSDTDSDFEDNFARPTTPDDFSWWGDRMGLKQNGMTMPRPQISKPVDRSSVRVRERSSTVGSSATKLSLSSTRQRASNQPQSRMPTRGTAVTGLTMSATTSGPVTHRSQWAESAFGADPKQPLNSVVSFQASREWEACETEREKDSSRREFSRSLSGQRLLTAPTPGRESSLTPSTSPRRSVPSSSKGLRRLAPKDAQNQPHGMKALERMASATSTTKDFVDGRAEFNYHGTCHFQANPWESSVPKTAQAAFPPGHPGDFRSTQTRHKEGNRSRFQFNKFALTTDGKYTTSLLAGPGQDRMVTWAGGRFFAEQERKLPGWNYSTKTRGAGWTMGPLILPEQDDTARWGIERKFKPLALKLMHHNFRGETVYDGAPLQVTFNRQWTTTDREQTKTLRERWYQYPLDRSLNGLPYKQDTICRTWD